MTAEHPELDTTRGTVREYLAELFDDVYEEDENQHFYVGYGSTVLEVSVEPYGPEETFVLVTSYCVQGIHAEEELLLGLLELNHELPVGAFSLVGKDVYYSHALFGRNLNRQDLLSTVAAVANISDDYDDRIVARYGGQTALERIQDTGGREQRRKAAPGPVSGE